MYVYIFKIFEQLKVIIMRFTLFFILCCVAVSMVTAEETMSQVKKEIGIDLSLTNASVVSVIEAISKETGYNFFYNEAYLSQLGNITIQLKDATLQQALEQVSKQTGLGFRKEDNVYTVVPAKEPVKTETKIQQGIRVTGTVSENSGELLPGVSVIVRGTTIGTTTDINGEFTITVPSDTSVLQFRFIGYQMQEIIVGNRRIIAVTMLEVVAEFEEVVVVAFGKQRKESLVSSIETVKVGELKVPSSNLTSAFAGRVAGLISYQTSGEPGADNAEFFVRGVSSFEGARSNPLILIDGFEATKAL